MASCMSLPLWCLVLQQVGVFTKDVSHSPGGFMDMLGRRPEGRGRGRGGSGCTVPARRRSWLSPCLC